MQDQESINQLFNSNSKAFADNIERRYHQGKYRRGEVFKKNITSLLKTPNASILDYGCGTGRMSLMLGKEGYNVVGVDPATDHIQIARSINTLSNVTFKVLGSSLEENNSAFDAVVSSSVFEFVPDPQAYIDDINRVLKPGGILFISFPNLFSLWRFYSKLRFGKKYNHFKFQKNLLGTAEIKNLFSKNNFKLLKGPVYYESAFDEKGLSLLSNSKFFGTLMLLVFKKS